MDSKANAIFNGGAGTAVMANSQGTGPIIDLFTYQISSKGTIIFPMVGEIYLEGKTIRQAKHYLEELVSPLVEYERADVDVRLVGRYFSVFGTTQSGRYAITQEKINIFQALAMAGDIGLFGDRSKIKIVRETENGTKTLEFDVRSLDLINSEYYYIEPNDAIYIQDVNERFFSVTSFPGALSFFFTTLSFVGVIVNLVK
jgi:polysaccharide export outer membrane protein